MLYPTSHKDQNDCGINEVGIDFCVAKASIHFNRRYRSSTNCIWKLMENFE